MTCARNALLPSHTGFTSTSSIVTVTVKLPLIPRYAPVPEPATTGIVTVKLTLPEQVLLLDGQGLNARMIFLWRLAMLSRNEPWVSSSLNSLVCPGSIAPSG